MSIVYFQSFCRVYQASGRGQSLYLIVTDYTPFGVLGQTSEFCLLAYFDVDHAGYHDAFHKAELIVQRSHYELARSGHQRYASARNHWDHPALHYRLIEGDTEILPGFSVIETSGHRYVQVTEARDASIETSRASVTNMNNTHAI